MPLLYRTRQGLTLPGRDLRCKNLIKMYGAFTLRTLALHRQTAPYPTTARLAAARLVKTSTGYSRPMVLSRTL